MNVLGIRVCFVSSKAEELAVFLDALGLARRPRGPDLDGSFSGATFDAGASFVETWCEGPHLPVGASD